MKELVEGGLPHSCSDIVVWYDGEEDQVVIQYDNFDINLYASDFLRLVELLNQAANNLESGIHEEG